jgi:hypothetical protein
LDREENQIKAAKLGWCGLLSEVPVAHVSAYPTLLKVKLPLESNYHMSQVTP